MKLACAVAPFAFGPAGPGRSAAPRDATCLGRTPPSPPPAGFMLAAAKLAMQHAPHTYMMEFGSGELRPAPLPEPEGEPWRWGRGAGALCCSVGDLHRPASCMRAHVPAMDRVSVGVRACTSCCPCKGGGRGKPCRRADVSVLTSACWGPGPPCWCRLCCPAADAAAALRAGGTRTKGEHAVESSLQPPRAAAVPPCSAAGP